MSYHTLTSTTVYIMISKQLLVFFTVKHPWACSKRMFLGALHLPQRSLKTQKILLKCALCVILNSLYSKGNIIVDYVMLCVVTNARRRKLLWRKHRYITSWIFLHSIIINSNQFHNIKLSHSRWFHLMLWYEVILHIWNRM